MEKMILVLDESVAKGHAKTREQFEGEIGVMASFLYHESEIRDIETNLDRVLACYRKFSKDKFHITDLDNTAQRNLRKEVFSLINEGNLQGFYQALYAEGFHQSEFAEGRSGEGNAT
jgi:hypothetical protein